MNKTSITNIIAVLAVIVVVAGAVWFKSQRDEPTPAALLAPSDPAVESNANGKPGAEGAPTTQPVALVIEPAATRPAVKLPRVVDLGADKCKACKKLAPILEGLKKEYAGRAIVEFIDVWKNPAAGEKYGIRVIPTQIFFDRDGKEVWRHEGFLPKAEFVAKFAELGVE